MGRDVVMCFSYLAFPFYLPASPAVGDGMRREGGEALRVLNGFFYFFWRRSFFAASGGRNVPDGRQWR